MKNRGGIRYEGGEGGRGSVTGVVERRLMNETKLLRGGQQENVCA